MKFKKGDKVRFLNDVGGGTVVRILDEKTVEILNDDDFEVPVLVRELVKINIAMESSVFSELSKDEKEDFTNYDFDTQEEEDVFDTSEDSILYIEGNDELNIYLAILPEKDSNSYAVYLINDSNYQAEVIVSEKEFDQLSNIWNGRLESNKKQKIKTYEEKELGAFPTLNIQILFFKFGKYNAINPLQKDVSIHPQKFYKKGSFVENDYFEEHAIIVKLNEEDLNESINQLSQEDINRIRYEKHNNDSVANTLDQKFKVKNTNTSILEIDLHIHELVENSKGLSNMEMLHIQMETFHKALNTGIKNHNTKRIVFIHGVGAGTLKNELRKALSNDYPQLYFQDASFKEYGFGATLVIIRRG